MKGVGIDIEKIERFRKRPYKANKQFYKKLFTRREIVYCAKFKDPAPHFTARFCAKEAAVKALGKAIDFKKIEIQNDKQGKPHLTIKGVEGRKCLVSLSHTDEYAIAIVLKF